MLSSGSAQGKTTTVRGPNVANTMTAAPTGSGSSERAMNDFGSAPYLDLDLTWAPFTTRSSDDPASKPDGGLFGPTHYESSWLGVVCACSLRRVRSK